MTDQPQIRVLLFAGLRETAGWGERFHPLSAECTRCTAKQLWETLKLPGSLKEVRVAINQQYADADTPLKAGDELAFLPPISGG